MTRKILFPIVLTLVMASCKEKEKNAPKIEQSATNIEVEKVTKTKTKNVISLSGNIEGLTTIRLGFLTAGRINYVSCKEGQNVSKGQLLASLDPTNYQLAKEISDSQVNSISDEYKRLKIMHDRGSLSDGEFSKIGFGLEQAKAQQKLQAKNLADTKLFSPISGVLLKKQAEEGEIINIGSSLFVVSDLSKVKVVAYIPESELRNVKIGQNATILVSSLGKNYTGKVKEVGSTADVSSRAFTVKIEIQNPKQLIRPGMIAEVKLLTNQEKETITLPAEAILRDLDKQSYVFVVDSLKNRAFKRKISIGNIIDDRIIVTAGLNIGESVVTAGQGKLDNGSLITLTK